MLSLLFAAKNDADTARDPQCVHANLALRRRVNGSNRGKQAVCDSGIRFAHLHSQMKVSSCDTCHREEFEMSLRQSLLVRVLSSVRIGFVAVIFMALSGAMTTVVAFDVDVPLGEVTVTGCLGEAADEGVWELLSLEIAHPIMVMSAQDLSEQVGSAVEIEGEWQEDGDGRFFMARHIRVTAEECLDAF